MKYIKLFMIGLIVSLSLSANGKASVNIHSLFLMLPDEAVFHLTKEERQAILDNKHGDKDFHLAVNDVKNAYLLFNNQAGKAWEICYWNTADAKKLLALNVLGEDGGLSFYLYDNATLKPTDAYGSKQLVQAAKQASKPVEYVLPREGKAIMAYVREDTQSSAFLISEKAQPRENGDKKALYKIYLWDKKSFSPLDVYPGEDVDKNTFLDRYVDALSKGDIDVLRAFFSPEYFYDQCLRFLEGRVRQCMTEAIGGYFQSSYIEPDKLSDIETVIKPAAKDLDEQYDDSLNIRIVELKDGRHYELSLDVVKEFNSEKGKNIYYIIAPQG